MNCQANSTQSADSVILRISTTTDLCVGVSRGSYLLVGASYADGNNKVSGESRRKSAMTIMGYKSVSSAIWPEQPNVDATGQIEQQQEERKVKAARCFRVLCFIYIFTLIVVFCGLVVIKVVVRAPHYFNADGVFDPITCVNMSSTGHCNTIIRASQREKYFTTKSIKLSDRPLKKSNLPLPPLAIAEQCSNVPDHVKFDCYPGIGANEASCKSRGCCWAPINSYTIDVPLDVPYCFYPPGYGGYSWVNITETQSGVTAFMRRTFKSSYPDDVPMLRVDVRFDTDTRIRVKIYDAVNTRFEPPYPEVPIFNRTPEHTLYRFEVDMNSTGFRVVRKTDGQAVFDSKDVGGLIFADQFIQISSLLPSDYIYGLGEHTSTFLLSTHWQKFTMWNHDSIPQENTNLYGSHPFYLALEKSGSSHGVFLLNSNAMEVILQPAPAVTFRTIGGILDLFVFLGPSPAEVAKQYSAVVGLPYMPPYWALGFHLCRFGYKTLNETKAVWKRTRDFGIPFDVQWNDLDYMNSSNDFTYDRVKFAGLPQFVSELHDLGMRYTVLIDPGISSSETPGTYPPYDRGLERGVFIENSTGQPFQGKVWNNVSTVWPDFTNPETVDYWTTQLGELHKEFAFDGAWIDMNEPSNFYSGTKHGCPDNKLENPPYLPAVDGGKLFYKTVCMSSKQFAGTHYNLHNLYGFTEAITTAFAMTELRGERPLVISRSTFPGHGHFAGHWTGDVRSTWLDMRRTIPQILNVNMFAIPLVGADICGFNGNTTAALCNRWSQLGAFYPFARNHNTDDGIEQDPVALGKDVATSAKNALTIRYSLLPYLYTLFHEAYVGGTTVARSLLFEFPNDPETFALDDQFLWGSALMIVPVLEADKVDVDAYLPSAVWYDFYSGARIPSSGTRVKLAAPLHVIPLLLRGGYVIPAQKAATTTTASRRNAIELIAVANETGTAAGSLFWDDGKSVDNVGRGSYTLLEFVMKDSTLTSRVVRWGYDDVLKLGKVRVLGVESAVKTVYANEAAVPFSYDTINKVLLVEGLSISLNGLVSVRWT